MRSQTKVKQSIPADKRYTVRDFNLEFPDDEACLEHIFHQRYPKKRIKCVGCTKLARHYRVTGRTAYACANCGHHLYPLAGSIFEKSTTSLRLWFYAMYLMGSTRCGISAKQIQRETGVTYKTAWRMFKQIRTLMSEDVKLEGSLVEMDETYVGGQRKYGRGRPARGDKKLTPVVGVVERNGGRVFATVTKDVTAYTLMGILKEKVLPESMVFTDEMPSYNLVQMQNKGYIHRRIKHASKVYVVGDIHTNTIEGFWSLIKRGIGGVYHQVSQKYLQSYLDEYSFRYNRRHSGNLIFTSILEKVSEKAC